MDASSPPVTGKHCQSEINLHDFYRILGTPNNGSTDGQILIFSKRHVTQTFKLMKIPLRTAIDVKWYEAICM